MPYTMSIMHTS